MTDLKLTELFELTYLQHIQDLFSDATGVASIITSLDGTPITKPSNFTRLCEKIIRTTEKGFANCKKSDAIIGYHNTTDPNIKPCLSGGLWDGGASITVGGVHVANWLIGQVKNKDLNLENMLSYANEIGADQEEYIKAMEEVPTMSVEQFSKIAELLFFIANELSEKAFRNKELETINNQLQIDATERYLAEKALTDSENIHQTIVKHIPQLIFIKDLNSNYLLCNDNYAKDLGISPKEIVGKSDFDLFPREFAEKFQHDDQKVMAEGIIQDFEEKYISSGKEIWTHVTKVPYRDSDNKIVGVLGIFEDITQNIQAREEIKQQNNQLKTINEEKDKFFSIIAHDLRSPFNSFLGFTELMSENLQGLSLEEIQSIAQKMRTSATNLYSLLENLLKWSLLHRGIMPYEPEKLNLNDLIFESIELIKSVAVKKNITIKIEIDRKIKVKADTQMLQSIIQNLVSNAIKFTNQGGNISVSSFTKNNNNISICIKDTGIGMNKKILENLFTLINNDNRKGTEGELSTGLGLLICKEFVEKNGGSIHAESQEGVGSQFIFTLPSA